MDTPRSVRHVRDSRSEVLWDWLVHEGLWGGWTFVGDCLVSTLTNSRYPVGEAPERAQHNSLGDFRKGESGRSALFDVCGPYRRWPVRLPIGTATLRIRPSVYFLFRA